MQLDDAAKEEIRWKISETIGSFNVCMHWVDSKVSRVRHYAVFDKRKPAGHRQITKPAPHAMAQAEKERLIADELIDHLQRMLADA